MPLERLITMKSSSISLLYEDVWGKGTDEEMTKEEMKERGECGCDSYVCVCVFLCVCVCVCVSVSWFVCL